MEADAGTLVTQSPLVTICFPTLSIPRFMFSFDGQRLKQNDYSRNEDKKAQDGPLSLVFGYPLLILESSFMMHLSLQVRVQKVSQARGRREDTEADLAFLFGVCLPNYLHLQSSRLAPFFTSESETSVTRKRRQVDSETNINIPP